ncbi:hypothetical protein ATKI12_6273 [Kitasatospora sp. Ki12]
MCPRAGSSGETEPRLTTVRRHRPIQHDPSHRHAARPDGRRGPPRQRQEQHAH